MGFFVQILRVLFGLFCVGAGVWMMRNMTMVEDTIFVIAVLVAGGAGTAISAFVDERP